MIVFASSFAMAIGLAAAPLEQAPSATPEAPGAAAATPSTAAATPSTSTAAPSTPAESPSTPAEGPSPWADPFSTTETEPVPPRPVGISAATPQTLLEVAKQALADGDRDLARTLYRQLRQRFPLAPEREALAQALGAKEPARHLGLALETQRSRRELPGAYSLRMGERLRLSWWEKTDFMLTTLAYGLTMGSVYALALESEEELLAAPLLAGTLGYPIVAGIWLGAAEVGRGDLPLALAITAYLPLSAFFVGLAAGVDDERDVFAAIAITGTLALPTAGLAVFNLDLDPGDVQLTRDAGFWGMALTLAATAALADRHGWIDGPTYGAAGLAGLGGGLLLGAVAAANSEVTLERVRVTTLGGYLGAILGVMVVFATQSADQPWGGAAGGAAIGLVGMFLATSSYDRPGGRETATSAASGAAPLSLAPSVTGVRDRSGRMVPALSLVLGAH
jgi:hypothetical protein